MKSKFKKWFSPIIMIIFGTCIMGFSFSVFLNPFNISPAGFSGLSAIISNFIITRFGVDIPPSVFYIILNAFLFIFAIKIMQKKFLVFSAIGILSFSLWMQVWSLVTIDVGSELLLNAIYGGLIMGTGTGLVVRNLGSTGGSDMLASIIRNMTKALSTGQIIIIVDAFVIALNILYYGLLFSLYSIITVILGGMMADKVIEGTRAVKAFYIVTGKKEQVGEYILKTLKRGVTEIKSVGFYTQKEKDMLLCLLNVRQVPILKNGIKEIDSEAFIFQTNVNEVYGEGFDILKKKEMLAKNKDVVDKNSDDNNN